jgi:Ca2+-binding EF-hand superfamily protein
MKILNLGLYCGMLLAISAIAGERPQSAWFDALDYNNDGGISLNELKAARNEKFYLLDINRDKVITPNEVVGSKTWNKRFIRLDTDANGFVNLAEFETMAANVFSFFDKNADGQITSYEALKFQHQAMQQNSIRKKIN